MNATTTADRLDALATNLRTLDVLADVHRDDAWWDHAGVVIALLEDVTQP